jgi:hypothetical protein
MGLILDSSVVIAAERRGDTVEQFIEKILKATGDQDAALCHWSHRARPRHLSRSDPRDTSAPRNVLKWTDGRSNGLSVYEWNRFAGRQNWRRAAKPRRGDSFGDLLIGATALSLGYKLLTGNLRDFERIPDLSVVQF